MVRRSVQLFLFCGIVLHCSELGCLFPLAMRYPDILLLSAGAPLCASLGAASTSLNAARPVTPAVRPGSAAQSPFTPARPSTPRGAAGGPGFACSRHPPLAATVTRNSELAIPLVRPPGSRVQHTTRVKSDDEFEAARDAFRRRIGAAREHIRRSTARAACAPGLSAAQGVAARCEVSASTAAEAMTEAVVPLPPRAPLGWNPLPTRSEHRSSAMQRSALHEEDVGESGPEPLEQWVSWLTVEKGCGAERAPTDDALLHEATYADEAEAEAALAIQHVMSASPIPRQKRHSSRANAPLHLPPHPPTHPPSTYALPRAPLV